MIFGAIPDLVILIFAVLALCKYMGLKARKMHVIASAGFMALLAAGSTLLGGIDSVGVVEGVSALFSVLAWILLLIGALMVSLELYKS